MNITNGQTTVFSLNQNGEGIALDEDGKTINIPFVLPGEKVKFECHTFKKKKKYWSIEQVTTNHDRITPVCRHFAQCGGCMLQHMNPTLYREFKHAQITNALNQYGVDPFVVDGVTILPFGKRRRANLDAIRKGDDIFLGFHRFRSHQIINVYECHTMDPALIRLLAPLREALLVVLESFQKAKIFFTLGHVGVDVSLEVQGVSALDDAKRSVLKTFAESAGLARLTFRYRKTHDVIHKQADPVVQFSGIDVAVDAYSFLQATVEADQHLADYVLAELRADANIIADLFCGRGTLSLPLATRALVYGYEFDRAALAALQTASAKAQHSIHLHNRDLFSNPLDAKELSVFDVIVIDPPRAGAEAQSHFMATSKAKQIIYVSCNPETFARDARLLTDGNFHLKKVHGVDQFAWSPHIEVIGVFEQK